MRISIVLCTYNGEMYLRQQLDSLTAQSRLPDEVIVGDDGSSDATCEILDAFACRAPFEVHLIRNNSNLGTTQNFAKAITACTGDIILLCDQDDIWDPRKLAIFEATFAKHPDVGLTFCDSAVVDAQLIPLNKTYWEVFGFATEQRRRRSIFNYSYVQGAAIGFRATLRNALLPFPPATLHDTWIAIIATGIGEVKAIPDVLLQWRQHARQQTGVTDQLAPKQKKSARESLQASRDSFDKNVEQLLAMLIPARDRLRSLPQARKYYVDAIDAHIRHLEIRVKMRSTPGFPVSSVLTELLQGNYSRYSLGWKSALADLLA